MADARVAAILATLAASGPASSWPDRLVEQCRAATRMTGVGLAVTSPAGAGGVVAATTGHAQQMEDLQFTLGEGPCMEASATGRPVLCSDLRRDGGARWPAFSPGAERAGVAAAFTFPVQVGGIAIGVLDLYRDRRGPLSSDQVTDAVAFADAAVAVLLHLLERDGEGGGRDGRGADWAGLVDERAVVHRAAGMISVQLGVGVTEALLRLRAHAYAQGRVTADLAAEVVARRVRFDHSDAGSTESSGRPDPDDSAEGAPS